ncbi:MAG: ferric reductase-like transmembrane domain-containing protein [Pseudomonadota bacterium]
MIQQRVIWAVLIIALTVPLVAAATSPYLAWRSPVYILAGFAGVISMSLLLLQPLLAARDVPGIPAMTARRWHRWVGIALVIAIAIHVGGLWITSPPDVLDALFFVSPTPFSAWGVIAMWAAFAAAALGVLRQRLSIRFRIWRLGHASLATITVLGSVVHAMLIEGTMEIMTKTALCILVLLAVIRALIKLRVWDAGHRR